MVQQTKRILMFDDDPTYGLTLKRQAAAMNIEAVFCQTIEDFCLKALEGSFDLALIDYHLDYFKGDTVSRIIEDRPVVLMSMDKDISHRRAEWPKSVVGFISKQNNAKDVLNSALNFTT